MSELSTDDGRRFRLSLKSVDGNGQLVEMGLTEMKKGGMTYVVSLPILRLESAAEATKED